ncbi:hypothetical protein BBJ29_006148 [Phytophthora kernoviae]|uniref:Kinesin motor domain-containing protein n=1 Tax=Phytophthora kernoviae TaxID=325452 RepID=A0A3R7KC99_9STRA|nr:hypothetical protein BBJ29_006148 [Phytophthora kernoviae]
MHSTTAMDGDANVKVFCRVRPPNERERGVTPTSLSGSAGFLARNAAASASFTKKCVTVPTSDPMQQTVFLHSKHGPARTFTFDRVFSEDASQTDVFHVVGAPITQACLEGYNGTIFAYGQTGSGKTFTMQGPDDVIDTENLSLTHEQIGLRGLVPRVFDYLFENVADKHQEGNVQHTFACSFLEIYNERVYDLLDGGSTKDATGLQLRENGRKGVHVEGLIESAVTSSKKAAELMTMGAQNRRVGQTSMNRESSRSHSVFILQLQSKETTAEGAKIRTSRFNLVDLAGSERQRSTDAAGERLKEAGSINKSLSALGNVILGLSEQSMGKHRHVHYRDSKLTFLLKDSLGGNSKTFMVATISPAEDSSFETLSTLKFAQRATMIQNSAVINEDSVGSASFLQEEIQQLRQQLQQAHQEIARNIPGSNLLLEGTTLSQVSEESVASPTLQLGPQVDPAIDNRFRELEESFATTAEKNDRLLRSCEYLQLENGNFQALVAELKQHVAHLKLMLRMRGIGGSELHEYEPTADAIEWRMRYEEMEERFAELQDELERSGMASKSVGVTGKISSEVENLNMMLLGLTNQLVFVLRDKHDLQDRLLENQSGKDEGTTGRPPTQEGADAYFSARLEEALKQQASEYQAKLDTVTSVSTCLEERAAETSLELHQIKQRESSWSIQQHDLERQLAEARRHLQSSEEVQSATQDKLVQEKLKVEELVVQLERAQEGVRLEFKASLADAAAAKRDLESAKDILEKQVAAVTAGLNQRDHQLLVAEKEFTQLKKEMTRLGEEKQKTDSYLSNIQAELKESTLQASVMRAEITDRDSAIEGLKQTEAAITDEKMVLQQKLVEAGEIVEQLKEDSNANAQKHAETIDGLKRQTEEERRKLATDFEDQLHVKDDQLQQLRVELDDQNAKAGEADRQHNLLVEEKQAALAAIQRQLDDHMQESRITLEESQQKLSDALGDMSTLSETKLQVESERASAVQEVERLQGDAKHLLLKNETMATEMQSLSDRVKQLSMEMSKLREHNIELQKVGDEQQTQLSSFEDSTKKFKQEVEELQQQVSTQSDEAAILRKELESAQEAGRDATVTHACQLDELASNSRAIEELKQMLAQKTNAMGEVSTKLEKAAGDIRKAESTASYQLGEIEMYKGIQATLRSEVRKLELDRLQLAESLKTEQESKHDSYLKFSDAQKRWLDDKTKLTQENQESISALEKQVEELTLNADTLSVQKRDLEHEIEALQISLANRERSMQELKNRVTERDDKISVLESSTVDSAATQSELVDIVAELRNSARDLERKLASQRSITSEQEAKITEKLAVISDRDATIRSLQEHKENGEVAWGVKSREFKAELEAANGRVQAFEQLVAEKSAVFAKAEDAFMAEKRSFKQKLKEGEEIAAQHIEQLMQDIKQLNSAIKAKDVELRTTNVQLEELEEHHKRNAEKTNSAKVEELCATIKELETKHKSVLAENMSLKENSEPTSKLRKLKEELSRRRSEVEVAENQITSERKVLGEEKAALAAAQSAQKEAKAKSAAQDTLGQAKRQFLREKVKLQREIQTLTKKLEVVSKENEKLVGHHNSRQKIQHHVKVKEENNRLLEQVQQLTEDKFKLQRTLEKLRSGAKEKENIGVDSRSNTPPSVSPASNASSNSAVTKKCVTNE